jgi:hypothetical protein
MSLPTSLRPSVTPPELELIACETLVEVIPLIAMERTAFISVCILNRFIAALSDLKSKNTNI